MQPLFMFTKVNCMSNSDRTLEEAENSLGGARLTLGVREQLLPPQEAQMAPLRGFKGSDL